MFIAFCAIFTVPIIVLADRTDNDRWALLLLVTIPLMIGLIVVGVECWGVVDWLPFSDCLK